MTSENIDKLTPAMRQVKDAKEKHPDAIIFFRMGDFYEMFFEDAEVASRVLAITLTARGKAYGKPIPMCGFPHKAALPYIRKMITNGYKVAICEQTEDPAKAKGLVRREVIRVVTPGTTFEDELLDGAANYIAAVSRSRGEYAVTFLEFSTGELEVWQATSPDKVIELIRSVSPSEILIPDNYDLPANDLDGALVSPLAQSYFKLAAAEATLSDHFGVSVLEGLGIGGKPAMASAIGALLLYISEVQPGSLKHIETIEVRHIGDRMFLDPETIHNLELVERISSSDGGGTLFSLMNCTATQMGSRMIRKWLLSPLLDIGQIKSRLTAVDEFYRRGDMRLEVEELLNGVADVERLAGRLALGSANPRDLVELGNSLKRVAPLRDTLSSANASLTNILMEQLEDVSETANRILDAIQQSPPVISTEGGLIRDGYDPALDELRTTVHEAKQYIARLQSTERERSNIPSLKVGYNKVFGYYIEVTKTHTDKIPEDYIRKQTLVNAERYITPQLKEYENIILTADERIHSTEYDLFTALRDELKEYVGLFKRVGAAAATLDAIITFAAVALENNFSRPDIVEGNILQIEEGRHAVVEKYFLTEPFVPNDTSLDEDSSFMVLTGPNMAGKSTYLRQVALIVVLAQAGSFVPARKATIGVVDRVFTRIGAADDLSRGRSTFLVEMAETANIINNATENSLILLDEVGRGTSTFDGLSLAWAVSEHIASNIKARTMFATHYHELAALANDEELNAVNYTVLVKETGGKVHFMRRVAPGVTDRSYGVQVARLAGLPPELLARARQILSELEDERPTSLGIAERSQTALFGGRLPVIEEYIAALSPEEMTPREAMEAIYKLKELTEE